MLFVIYKMYYLLQILLQCTKFNLFVYKERIISICYDSNHNLECSRSLFNTLAVIKNGPPLYFKCKS